MSDHLSQLELDVIASGGSGARDEHLQGCTECRARLERLTERHRQIAALPEFEARFHRLPQTGQAPAPRRRVGSRLAIVVSLAAALAVMVLFPRSGDDTRLKGAPTVSLLSGERSVTRAAPGDRLRLSLGGAGHSHAAVFVIDTRGSIDVLWPAGDRLASIPPGANAPLDSILEVTPGSVEVVAIFGDEPRELASVRAVLRQAVAEAIGSRRPALEFTIPTTIGPSARVHLEVSP